MTDRSLGDVPPHGRDAAPGAPEGQGRLVGRRYRLLAPVGRGGMGIVWHAHDVLLDRDVAVKELILPFGLDHAGKQVAHRRMMREARSAARLSHPGIVTVHDVVEEDGRPWIVMELIHAWSLEQAVRQNGPLPVVQAAEIGIRVLDALRHAHAAGILHRDVKPGNVLLTADRVVLTDFGIAAIEGDVTVTQTGLLMGSPAYIPPERLQGHAITPAADLWSFGATLYAAVEGRPPYEGPDAVAVLGAVLTQEPTRPERAGALLPVIEGLLRKNPADRISAAQASDLLERVLRAHGSTVSSQALTETSSSPATAGSPPPRPVSPPQPPSGPMPSRIIETPSGPVRVPYKPPQQPSPYDPATGQNPIHTTNPVPRPVSPLSAPPSGSTTPVVAFDAFARPSQPVRPSGSEGFDAFSSPSRPVRQGGFDAFGGGTARPAASPKFEALDGTPRPTSGPGFDAFMTGAIADNPFAEPRRPEPVDEFDAFASPSGPLPTTGYDAFGSPSRDLPRRTGRAADRQGFDAFGSPSGPQRQNFDAFGPPSGPQRQGFDAFGPPSGPQRQGFDAFGSPSGPQRQNFDAFGSPSRPLPTVGYDATGRPAQDLPGRFDAFAGASGRPGDGRTTGERRLHSGAFEAIRVSRANAAVDPAISGIARDQGDRGIRSRRGDDERPPERGRDGGSRLRVVRLDAARGLRRRVDNEWWRDGRPTPRMLLTAAGVLGATVITILLLQAGGEPQEPAVAPPTTSSVSAGPSEQPRQVALAPGEIPKGYATRVEGGISAVVPENWTVSAVGGRITFSGPEGSEQLVTVTQVPSAPDGGFAALERERERSRLADYLQVQLQSVRMGDWEAADWEYTHTQANGVPMHTLTRYVTISDQLAYKITFAAPELRWNEGTQMREIFLANFTAPA